MKTTIIAIVVLAVLVGGYYLYQNSATRAPAPAATPAAPTPPLAVTTGETHEVIMDASGFMPANLSIKAGDTVMFKNDDTRTRWPASGLHPTHQLCAGFDALKPLATNETYSHTFTAAKECPMHDHLIPSLRGKVTVTE